MLTIGVDLGGTNLAAGIVDNGKILHKMSVATNFKEGAGALIADIARLCNELTADFENIVSIGIGCPGIVNPKEGILVKAPNLGLFNIEISQPLSRLLNLPVFIENDANCAALGEHSRGAAKGAVSSITVTLGTGVGGGIIIDGKIYSGPFFGAGEIGHHVIVVGGEACNCGRRGCWEAYASANALKKQGFSPRTIFKDAKTNEAAK
ncbi:MAG: ROK family protein, partial [Clostridiales bacterium]|nr:ROK family protein [Clostridiales bacterium]